MTKLLKVAVIGAGMAGIACAYELTKAGHDVTLFEKGTQVGGRAGTRYSAGYPFDLGAQFLNNGYLEAKRYCQELGMAGEWGTLSPSTHHLFHQGELKCISYRSVREFWGLGAYSPLARTRLILCYLELRRRSKGIDLYDLCKINADLDTISAKDFVLKWGGEEVLDYAFDAMIATYHFHGAEDLSLACLLGAISAIGEGFSYDYFCHGMSTLAREMVKKLRVHTSTPVQAIKRGPGGLIVEGIHGHNLFDRIVIATTASEARRIVHHPSDAQRNFLNSVRFAATINAGFRVPNAAVSHLAMVAVPLSQNGNICCYINQNSKYPQRFEEGQTLINVFLRDEKAQEWLHYSDETLWDLIQQEFLKVCPPLASVAHRVYRHDLQRWPEAIPKYYPGYITTTSKFWQQGQGDYGLYLCGDYLNAPWMEGSLRCGQKVAQLVANSSL